MDKRKCATSAYGSHSFYIQIYNMQNFDLGKKKRLHRHKLSDSCKKTENPILLSMVSINKSWLFLMCGSHAKQKQNESSCSFIANTVHVHNFTVLDRQLTFFSYWRPIIKHTVQQIPENRISCLATFDWILPSPVCTAAVVFSTVLSNGCFLLWWQKRTKEIRLKNILNSDWHQIPATGGRLNQV